jgi:hypothetical protein
MAAKSTETTNDSPPGKYCANSSAAMGAVRHFQTPPKTAAQIEIKTRARTQGPARIDL